MKNLITKILLLATILFLNNLSIAQDNNISKYSDEQKLKTKYIPEKKISYVPLRLENNIMFLSNCPPVDNSLTCLKYPLDATFVVPLFNGPGCNGQANPLDPLQRNDDDVTLAIPLSFNFNLYGTVYTTVFINNNGNVTFGDDFCAYTPFGFPSSLVAMVAPFFADVDTRNLSSGVVWMKSEANRFTVIWDSVGYFNVHADKLNKFELIISDGTDPLVGIGNNICFSYGDMEWTTGDASGGIGGFGGSPATVGVNKGDGVTYATLGRFNRPGSYYGGPGVDTNGVSYLDCRSFCFDASNVGNICPVPSGFPAGPVIVDPGPYVATYSMSAPEVGQIVSGSVTGVPPGMSVVITNGLTLTFAVTFLPPCDTLGSFTRLVCFTGIDNASDRCTTRVCVEFRWDCPLPVEMSSFSSSVAGRNVMLEWTTLTELNNARFEVERSVNDIWVKIGSVEGSGTTSSQKNYSYFDRGLNSATYNYRLKQIDYNGNFEYFDLSNEVVIGIPNSFELAQNYPNPFNPATRIEYSIPYEGKVRLTIYDVMGKEVSKLVDNNQSAGYYSVDFNASNLSSGIYYYRIEVSGQNNFADSKKMLLVK